MLETGQPLHAYDAATLTGGITVRRARAGGDPGHPGRPDPHPRPPEDLLITDESGPIGLAGVMGGQNTELRADTTTVVIEAATFDQVSIARTSRRHKLSSEASRRFERGVDPNATYAAAHRVATLLTELAGGAPSSRPRPSRAAYPRSRSRRSTPTCRPGSSAPTFRWRPRSRSSPLPAYRWSRWGSDSC